MGWTLTNCKAHLQVHFIFLNSFVLHLISRLLVRKNMPSSWPWCNFSNNLIKESPPSHPRAHQHNPEQPFQMRQANHWKRRLGSINSMKSDQHWCCLIRRLEDKTGLSIESGQLARLSSWESKARQCNGGRIASEGKHPDPMHAYSEEVGFSQFKRTYFRGSACRTAAYVEIAALGKCGTGDLKVPRAFLRFSKLYFPCKTSFLRGSVV